jgi:hypothetical protein
MQRRRHGRKLLALAGAALLLITLAGVAIAGDNGGSGLSFAPTLKQHVLINETTSVQHLGWTGYTLEAWVRPSNIFNIQSIIRNNNDYNMFIDGGDLRANVAPGGDGTQHVTNTIATSGISATQWTHVAATWLTPTVQLYVNGLPVASQTNSITWTFGSANLSIGAGQGGTFPFTGEIDEVRIWNTPRSAEQIRATMFQPLSGSEANLVGYWPFNEGAGQTTVDASGHGNYGVLGLNATDTISDPTWLGASTAPLASLASAYQNGVAGMWAGRPNTASDGVVTGLDIADVTFLNAEGDDIIFGHNNAAFHSGVTDNLTTTLHAKKRWARLWELDVNDAGATGGNVDLTFDISDAGGADTFSSGGSYYLLRRPTGSAADFEEVTLVGAPIVSGDRITFRVSVTTLGSEFTVGATSSSPSAVNLTQIAAHATSATVVPGLVVGAAGLTIFGLQQARKRRK